MSLALVLAFALGMATSPLLVWAAWKTLLSRPERACDLLDGIYEKASGRTSREMVRAAHRRWVARTQSSSEGHSCPTCGWAAP